MIDIDATGIPAKATPFDPSGVDRWREQVAIEPTSLFPTIYLPLVLR